MTHAGYILAAYAVAALVIGVLVVRASLEYRGLKASLARLAARGARRRSEPSA